MPVTLQACQGIQYGVPVFVNAHGDPVIYLFGSKRHVNSGFLKSDELMDRDGVLKGSGKPSKHISILPDKGYDEALLSVFMKQCEKLNS